MGCFDWTCAATNLPISCSDPIIMLYGVKYPNHLGMEGFNFGGKYKVMSLPIIGEYDDYGEVENIVNSDKQYSLNKTYIETDFEKVCKPTFRSHNSIFETFQDNVHLGQQNAPDEYCIFKSKSTEFKLKKPFLNYPPVYDQTVSNGSSVEKMMIHKPIWDLLISEYDKLSVIKHKYDFDNISQITIEGLKEYIEFRKLQNSQLNHKHILKKYELMLSLDVNGWDYNATLDNNFGKFILQKLSNEFDTDIAESILNLDKFVFMLKRKVGRDLFPSAKVHGQHQETDQMEYAKLFLEKCIEIQNTKLKYREENDEDE